MKKSIEQQTKEFMSQVKKLDGEAFTSRPDMVLLTDSKIPFNQLSSIEKNDKRFTRSNY